MPGLDRTGPSGYDPLNGRRGGYCRGSIPLRRAFYESGSVRQGSGMGGFGRGFRWQYLETGQPRWARTSAKDPSVRAEETVILPNSLEREVEGLEEQLNDVKAYLESLKLATRGDSEGVTSDTTLERRE
ncbi:MAG: DUF5320 domain-containing protein [Halobacteriota archaeon]